MQIINSDLRRIVAVSVTYSLMFRERHSEPAYWFDDDLHLCPWEKPVNLHTSGNRVHTHEIDSHPNGRSKSGRRRI